MDVKEKIYDYFNEQVSCIDTVEIEGKIYLSTESNDDLEKFEEFLNNNNYSLEQYNIDNEIEDVIYSESWLRCSECGKAMFIPDYQAPDYIFTGDEVLCKDCLGDLDDDLEDYINNSKKAVYTTIDVESKLLKDGWEKIETYSYQWGENSNPENTTKEVLNRIIDENIQNNIECDVDFVWIADRVEMFGTVASLYVKKN